MVWGGGGNEKKNLNYKWMYIICHNKPITGILDKKKKSVSPPAICEKKVSKYLTVMNEKKKGVT